MGSIDAMVSQILKYEIFSGLSFLVRDHKFLIARNSLLIFIREIFLLFFPKKLPRPQSRKIANPWS